MKGYPHIKMTKREFVRQKRRELKKAKKAISELHSGATITTIYGNLDFCKALHRVDAELETLDKITKRLS